MTYEELPWTRKRALANAKRKALRAVMGAREYKRFRRSRLRFPCMSDLAGMRFIDMAELLTKAALGGDEDQHDPALAALLSAPPLRAPLTIDEKAAIERYRSRSIIRRRAAEGDPVEAAILDDLAKVQR